MKEEKRGREERKRKKKRKGEIQRRKKRREGEKERKRERKKTFFKTLPSSAHLAKDSSICSGESEYKISTTHKKANLLKRRESAWRWGALVSLSLPYFNERN